MRTGVQWTATLAPGESHRYFTFNWPAVWHIIWTMVPTSPESGSPQIDWDVAIERASTNFCTYWITVENLTTNPVTFEGRYAILN